MLAHRCRSTTMLSTVLLWLCALALPSAVSAQTATIAGTVLDAETDRALSDVRITLEGHDRPVLSEEDGNFVIPDLPAGSYLVTAELPGYGPVEREVRVSRGQELRLRVELAREARQLAGITVEVERGYIADRGVTATKMSTPLVEVPKTVSVLTRDRLDAQGVETQAEALRDTGGVRSEPFGPDMLVDWTQIRGFQQFGQNLFRD